MQTASHGNLTKHNVNAFLIVSPLPICQYEMGIIFTQWESKDGQQSCISIPSSYCQYTTRNYICKWLLSNRELSAKFLLRNAPFQVKAELSKQTGGLDDSAYWQPSVALPSKQRIYVLYNARASILCCHNLQVGTHSNDHRTVPSVCQYVYHMNTEVHQPHHGACVPWV